MGLSESVKPISYLKAHAFELIRDVADNGRMLVITHHGEAKAVVQDLAGYQKMCDTLAMVKMLARSSKSKLRGRGKPVGQAFKDLRARIKDLQ